MNKLISVFILVLLSGCATTGALVTENNNKVNTAHYSVEIPANQEWRLLMPPSNTELALITKQIGPFIFQMKTMTNFIFDKELKSKNAKEIADDFRNLEKNIMIENGVNKGLYELQDLVMDEETVGDKHFYTMRYSILSPNGTQRAFMYLYFPSDKGHDYFFLAHYSETIPKNAFLAKSFKPDFIETLKSLQTRN